MIILIPLSSFPGTRKMLKRTQNAFFTIFLVNGPYFQQNKSTISKIELQGSLYEGPTCLGKYLGSRDTHFQHFFTHSILYIYEVTKPALNMAMQQIIQTWNAIYVSFVPKLFFEYNFFCNVSLLVYMHIYPFKHKENRTRSEVLFLFFPFSAKKSVIFRDWSNWTCHT